MLRQAPGLDLVDDPAKNEYPLPLEQAEKYNCAVGRIRQDCALDNGLYFWVSGDQLLKGAALNAVQIAEELIYANEHIYVNLYENSRFKTEVISSSSRFIEIIKHKYPLHHLERGMQISVSPTI